MTLHLIDIGTPVTARPTRMRSIVESLNAQAVGPDRIVAVGTATEHARAAGLRAGRVLGVHPSARRLARWTGGHGRVVAWGEWQRGVPDGVAWAERAPTSWNTVPAASWCPSQGAPLVLWCGEPASSICSLTAVAVAARLNLLGCDVRVAVTPAAARLDRARALARDMRVGDSLIVLEDHAALATIAAHAAVAVAAPTDGDACAMATQAVVPECLAAFAAAGTPCMAPHGSALESWVLQPDSPGINALALCLARVLGSADERAVAGEQARAAAECHRGSLTSA